MHSYGKPLNLGDKNLTNLFDGPFVIQEKIDGSQFSFGITSEGELEMRSRGQTINPSNAGMFAPAVVVVMKLENKLIPGLIYRGEYLQKPKHNVLAYSRIPKNHIILFDIEADNGLCLQLDDLELEAHELGLECVPCLYENEELDNTVLLSVSLEGFLDTDSILGGVKIEGVVIKNYTQKDRDGKTLMGKFVAPAFREQQTGKKEKKMDIIEDILDTYQSEARWQKAVQHLQENGELTGTLKDIGPLMRELAVDFEEETSETIKALLYEHYRKNILRGIQAGFPEWYKQKLYNDAYANDPSNYNMFDPNAD